MEMTNTYTRNRQNNFSGAIYDKVASSISYTLMNNAGDWITADEIADITGGAFGHIAEVLEEYDPSRGASLLTWATTVGVNYAISEGRKLSRRNGKFDRLESHMSYIHDDSVNEGVEDIAGELYVPGTSECDGNLAIENLDERLVVRTRQEWFDMKAKSSLKPQQYEIYRMMVAGLSKEEMMARTGMSGGTLDTAKSRLRVKLKAFAQEWFSYSEEEGLE